MSFLVIELQTLEDGSVANNVFSFDNMNEAEAKYHTVLSYAAVSTIPCHAAVMIRADGMYIKSQSYDKKYEDVEEE